MSWTVVSCWIEGHTGLASWVQAFGSIAALGIAIWIASSQRRVQLKADKEKSRLLLGLVVTLAGRAERAVVFESKEASSIRANLNLIKEIGRAHV